MMHSYSPSFHSPSHRQLAVPGIGFPQNIPIGSDAIDPAASRDWSDDRFDARSQPIERVARRPSLWACLSAGW
jgi:hypothetical protein